jgi:hypothetical protein
VLSVAAPPDVCLSVTVVSADAGTLKTIISIITPTGAVYRFAHAGAVAPTPILGWYTIQVDTAPPAREQLFEVSIGLEPLGPC